MQNHYEKRSLLIIVSVFTFVIVGTYLTILFANGYRPNLNSNNITLDATGLFSVTSKPKGASVYIDDKLTTATDDTLNLSPKDYFIKIVKDGYLPWQKSIQIKKELVYQSDAQLFRSAPDLSPITLAGAINPIISPDYSKIIYSVASASAEVDNGLYLIELSNIPLSLNKNTPRQLAPNYSHVDWSKATFSFSPDSRKVLVSFSNNSQNYLLNLDNTLNSVSLVDVTARLSIIKAEWLTLEQTIVQTRLAQLPLEIRPLISTASAQFISFSTGDDKILYLAKSDTSIPVNLISPPPAQSTQAQTRNLKKDNYYVYDLKDDTNFLVGSITTIHNPTWLPNSTNLIFIEDQAIKAVDYDSTNKVTLFAGNIKSDKVFPWADGSKIIVLTSAYQGAAENLYAVTIR